MKIEFSKYHGTGNDFIMLNNMNGKYDSLNVVDIVALCDRNFGIGADGLIKLCSHDGFDFEIDYYNADGTKSFCGNGARCSVLFAKYMRVTNSDSMSFHAFDGPHLAMIKENEVRLEMLAVDKINRFEDDLILDTGSPHYIKFKDKQEEMDIIKYGRQIRYSEVYKEDGINVNLLEEISLGLIHVTTYERGVEDETLSCGTGVVASAIAYMDKHKDTSPVKVRTKGGELMVEANLDSKTGGYDNIWLSGPAIRVFDGIIDI